MKKKITKKPMKKAIKDVDWLQDSLSDTESRNSALEKDNRYLIKEVEELNNEIDMICNVSCEEDVSVSPEEDVRLSPRELADLYLKSVGMTAVDTEYLNHRRAYYDEHMGKIYKVTCKACQTDNLIRF